jgi:hypothetical protein
VGLACDDSKVHTDLRTYTDPKTGSLIIVGQTGPVRVIGSEEDLKGMLSGKDGDLEKATKLRLWVVSMPMPGMAPIIVAAQANPEKRSAAEHFEDLMLVLHLLRHQHIRVVSYSCDGTQVERDVQAMLMRNEPLYHSFVIPHPNGSSDDLEVPIGSAGGQPIVVVQDSKHFAKTARNNLFSGAHVNTMGNFTALYEDCRPLAGFGQDIDSRDYPCYPRDIEKTDKQDDNAAQRLLSSKALAYLHDHHSPDALGLIVYLFVFGELVDAVQNRKIGHSARITMALRAWYFLSIWLQYLAKAELPKARHCISREAIDIIRIIVQSIIGLIIIYRDHLPTGMSFPLLLWLHSTEACEHFFGLMRQKVKDFSYRDFLYMVDWLHRLLRAAMNRKSDPKARAAGYAHTWSDMTGLDLGALSNFPTDSEIWTAAGTAWHEAVQLWAMLGVRVSDLQSAQPTHLQQAYSRVPSMSTSRQHELASDSDDEGSSEFEYDSDSSNDETAVSVASVRHIVEHMEKNQLIRIASVHEAEFDSVKAAVVFLSADEQTWM